MNFIEDYLATGVSTGYSAVLAYLPRLFAGFLILFIGLIVASLLKDFIRLVFKYLRLEKWLKAAGITGEREIAVWPNLLSELIRWITIFIFLMSAVEAWGVPKVGDVLAQLLLFLPNVLVAVIIGWIGFVIARFVFEIVRHAVQGIGGREAAILGNFAKYAVIFFTVLIILTQLGVAADLVKILFTGIVSMLALAGGLAFGLGGQEQAKNILKELTKKLQITSSPKKKI